MEWSTTLIFVGCHARGLSSRYVEGFLVRRKGKPRVTSGGIADVRDIKMGKMRVKGERVYVREIECAHKQLHV